MHYVWHKFFICGAKIKNMKRLNLGIFGMALAVAVISCNEGSNTTAATSTSDDTGTTVTNPTGTVGDTTSMTGGSNMPLSGQDSTFAMKAAAGGMMEVEAGNAAQ